jgi:hypothetical protein
MLKHCIANRNRRVSALPNVGPYIYDISGLRVNNALPRVGCAALLDDEWEGKPKEREIKT